MAVTIGTLLVDFRTRTTQFQQGIARAGRSVATFQRGLSVLDISLGRLGVLFGIRQVSQFLNDMREAADSIGKMSDELGISTDQLQQWQFVASQAGINAREFDSSLQRFSKRIGEATAGMGAAVIGFRDLGIEIKNVDGTTRDFDDIFIETMQNLAGMEDQMLRNATAARLFGREGIAMVNMVRGGYTEFERLVEQFKEYGLGMDESVIRRSEETTDALDVLSRKIRTALYSAWVDYMLPPLNWAAEKLVQLMVLTEEYGSAGIDYLAQRIRDVGAMFGLFTEEADDAAMSLEDVKSRLGELAGEIEEAQKQVDAYRTVMEHTSDADGWKHLNKALEDHLNTLDELTEEKEKLTELHEKLHKAQLEEESSTSKLGRSYALLTKRNTLLTESLTKFEEKLVTTADPFDLLIEKMEKNDELMRDNITTSAVYGQANDSLASELDKLAQTFGYTTDEVDNNRRAIVNWGAEWARTLVDIAHDIGEWEGIVLRALDNIASRLLENFITGQLAGLFSFGSNGGERSGSGFSLGIPFAAIGKSLKAGAAKIGEFFSGTVAAEAAKTTGIGARAGNVPFAGVAGGSIPFGGASAGAVGSPAALAMADLEYLVGSQMASGAGGAAGAGFGSGFASAGGPWAIAAATALQIYSRSQKDVTSHLRKALPGLVAQGPSASVGGGIDMFGIVGTDKGARALLQFNDNSSDLVDYLQVNGLKAHDLSDAFLTDEGFFAIEPSKVEATGVAAAKALESGFLSEFNIEDFDIQRLGDKVGDVTASMEANFKGGAEAITKLMERMASETDAQFKIIDSAAGNTKVAITGDVEAAVQFILEEFGHMGIEVPEILRMIEEGGEATFMHMADSIGVATGAMQNLTAAAREAAAAAAGAHNIGGVSHGTPFGVSPLGIPLTAPAGSGQNDRSIWGFPNGGSILVHGAGGIDSRLMQFAASPGEEITVERPGMPSTAHEMRMVRHAVEALDTRAIVDQLRRMERRGGRA